jgi:hypothetical protein
LWHSDNGHALRKLKHAVIRPFAFGLGDNYVLDATFMPVPSANVGYGDFKGVDLIVDYQLRKIILLDNKKW